MLAIATVAALGFAMGPLGAVRMRHGASVHMNGGKGFGGGEATRDPEPTAYDPNDPKGKQQAIHKAETFAEYLAKRSAGGAVEAAAPAAAAPAPPRTEVAMVSPKGDVFHDQSIMTECLLLPKEPFPGRPHMAIVGEVSLQELEDDEETRSQLFFHEDGTVSHGATDGPPPAGFCGLWQCGESTFQMTLSRAFSAPSAIGRRTGRMSDDITYTVVRVYEGTVERDSTGVAIVEGRIDLIKDEDAAQWSGSGATSIAALDPFASIQLPPIGYFVLDTNTGLELE